jgi:hypothetical protein
MFYFKNVLYFIFILRDKTINKFRIKQICKIIKNYLELYYIILYI